MQKTLAARVRFGVVLLVLASLACVSNSGYAQNPSPVVVITPQKQNASLTIELSGTSRARRLSNVSARIAGAVEQVYVDDGSQVGEGDLLFALDETLGNTELARLEAELARAKAEASEAQRLVDEANRLIKSKHIAATEVALRKTRLLTANATLQATQSQFQAQQQRLNFHKIRAPFSGVVTRRIAEKGEWVTQGMAVVELVSISDTFLDVEIPQRDFYRLTSDTRVEIQPSTDIDTILSAKIAVSVPAVNETTRTFRLRLQAEDAGDLLPPGASAVATFYIPSSDKNVLTVPRDALLRNPDNSYALFVIDDSAEPKALRQKVKVGQILGTEIEILSGLNESSKVVVRGNEILRHGNPVVITR